MTWDSVIVASIGDAIAVVV